MYPIIMTANKAGKIINSGKNHSFLSLQREQNECTTLNETENEDTFFGFIKCD